MRIIEDNNRRLNENLNLCIDELSRITGQSRSGPVSQRVNTLEASLAFGSLILCADYNTLQADERTLRKQPSFKWAQFRGARSPTKQESSAGHSESPHPSPQRSEYDMTNGRSAPPPSYQPMYDRSTPSRQANYGAATSSDAGAVIPSQTARQLTARPDPPSGSSNSSSNPPTSISTSSDNLKSFKVSLDDPAWKVLPAALKKYKINNDDWQNYAMFICYGSTGKLNSNSQLHLILTGSQNAV